MDKIIIHTGLRDINDYNKDAERYTKAVINKLQNYKLETKLYDYISHKETSKEQSEFYYFETVVSPRDAKERNEVILFLTNSMRKITCEIESYKLGNNNIVKFSNVFFTVSTIEEETKLCNFRTEALLNMLKENFIFSLENGASVSVNKPYIMQEVKYWQNRLEYAKEQHRNNLPIIPEYFDKQWE